jgi:hypothetical protein
MESKEAKGPSNFWTLEIEKMDGKDVVCRFLLHVSLWMIEQEAWDGSTNFCALHTMIPDQCPPLITDCTFLHKGMRNLHHHKDWMSETMLLETPRPPFC